MSITTIRRSGLGWILAVDLIALIALSATACSSTPLPGADGTGGSGQGGAAAAGIGGTTGSAGAIGAAGQGAGGSAGRDAGSDADALVCCPPDATMSGCMHLGGASYGGACYLTCDFFCSSNWRIEQDAQGCAIWRYDWNSCG